ETSRKWLDDERQVLELDSRMRNLRFVLNREERALATNEAKSEKAPNVQAELKTLTDLQAIDEVLIAKLEEEVVDVESLRKQHQLLYFQSQQERELVFREFEHAKLTAIAATFPDRSETALYILGQLLTEGQCLVCGNRAPHAQSEYASRIDAKR